MLTLLTILERVDPKPSGVEVLSALGVVLTAHRLKQQFVSGTQLWTSVSPMCPDPVGGQRCRI
jgi:hypothetical protein